MNNVTIDSSLLIKLGWHDEVDDMRVYYTKGPFIGYFDDNVFIVGILKLVASPVFMKMRMCSSVAELYEFIKEYYDVLLKRNEEERKVIMDTFELLEKEKENIGK